jgi:hypothetical protein
VGISSFGLRLIYGLHENDWWWQRENLITKIIFRAQNFSGKSWIRQFRNIHFKNPDHKKKLKFFKHKSLSSQKHTFMLFSVHFFEFYIKCFSCIVFGFSFSIFHIKIFFIYIFAVQYHKIMYKNNDNRAVFFI